MQGALPTNMLTTNLPTVTTAANRYRAMVDRGVSSTRAWEAMMVRLDDAMACAPGADLPTLVDMYEDCGMRCSAPMGGW